MTNYFVTRHPGAQEWFTENFGAEVVQVQHWTPALTEALNPGDSVIGILPVDMGAEVCAKGARFVVLSIPRIPPEFRGKELTKHQMVEFGANLREYHITAV